MSRACSTNVEEVVEEEEHNVYGVLVRKLKGKRRLIRPKCSWVDNMS
jgi:cobyric acid synthase